MTPPASEPPPTPPSPAALTAYWLECWRQALLGGGLAAVALHCDARQIQRRFMTDLTRTLDGYLRTPAFLELMKRNLGTMAPPSDPVPPSFPR
jgi:hypothetical protein